MDDSAGLPLGKDEVFRNRVLHAVHPASSSAIAALHTSAASAHSTVMIVQGLRRLLRPTVWVTAERVFTEVFSLSEEGLLRSRKRYYFIAPR